MKPKEDCRGLRSSLPSGAQRLLGESNPIKTTLGAPFGAWRNLFLLALGTAIFLLPQSGRGNDSSSPRHIVMIILEDVSRGCFEKGGAADERPTRVLEEWANNHAVSFRHAYANAAVCNPSRAAIFTCKLPEQTDVFSNADDWRGHGSVIQYLKEDRGYHTVRIDKVFHKSKYPHPESWSKTVDGRWPKPVGPPVSEIPGLMPGNVPMAYGPSGLKGSEDADHARARKAIQMIEEFDESGGESLCLMVGLKSTHLPFRYPIDYQRALQVSPQSPARKKQPAWLGGSIPLSDQLVLGAIREEIAAAYFSCLEYELDCAVEILEAARERFHDNLVSVVVSDHGFALGEKGIWRKPNTIDETTRVPLFISAPGLEPGSEITGPFELARLIPAVLDLANVPAYPEAHYLSSVEDIKLGRMPAGTLATTYAGRPNWKVVRNDRFALHRWKGFDTLTDLADGEAFSPDAEALLRIAFGSERIPLAADLRAEVVPGGISP